MAYNLGVVGIGHWFERLYAGMLKTDQIHLLKAASASGVDKKKAQLEKLKLPDSSYYQIKGSEIPSDFFAGLDIVHISDPNEFHAAQTIQALTEGKITLTEKTFGVNKEEFDTVVTYIRENNLQNRAYLHLHYAHKLLTSELLEMLKRFTKDYGKVVSSSATFFEKDVDEPRKRRLWLFSKESGGLFMDWIHPFEIYYRGALAEKMDLKEIKLYETNPDYAIKDPTGIYAKVQLEGTFLKDRVDAHIRVAKGLKKDQQKKQMSFTFESGQILIINFVDSEVEYSSPNRGEWELRGAEGGDFIVAGVPTGPNASDIFVNDILELCRGRNPGFTIDDLEIVYGPQWRYQELAKDSKLITDSGEVAAFVQEGLK